MFLNFITWNVDPVLVHLGPLAIRWYGLLWAIGIYATLLIVQKLFKHEGLPEVWLDKLFMYTVIGTIVVHVWVIACFTNGIIFRNIPLKFCISGTVD